MAMKLVLIRHGQSLWNLENRFTGWIDQDLSEAGRAEASEGGRALKDEGFVFDVAYTSVLKRAIRTLWIVLDELDALWLPVVRSWRLNERHYGGLQGKNKTETVKIHGEEQVQIWRRSFDVPPPPLKKPPKEGWVAPHAFGDISWEEWPESESLKDTIARVLPFWHGTIVPELKAKKRVLIVAHGNSLRALVKYLDQMSDEAITKLNIPTGIPLVYELDDELKPLNHKYLGDPERIKQAIESVAGQLKKG